MGMKSEIEEALRDHALWRKCFRDYLNGRAPFDPATACASDRCDLGKWLDDRGRRLLPAELEGEVRSAHDEFHRLAAEVIGMIQEKRYAEARRDLSQEGPLNRASARLSEALLKAQLHEGSAMGSVPPQAGATPPAQEGEGGSGMPADASVPATTAGTRPAS